MPSTWALSNSATHISKQSDRPHETVVFPSRGEIGAEALDIVPLSSSERVLCDIDNFYKIVKYSGSMRCKYGAP